MDREVIIIYPWLLNTMKKDMHKLGDMSLIELMYLRDLVNLRIKEERFPKAAAKRKSEVPF